MSFKEVCKEYYSNFKHKGNWLGVSIGTTLAILLSGGDIYKFCWVFGVSIIIAPAMTTILTYKMEKKIRNLDKQ